MHADILSKSGRIRIFALARTTVAPLRVGRSRSHSRPSPGGGGGMEEPPVVSGQVLAVSDGSLFSLSAVKSKVIIDQ